jgi:urease accessory protein UreE
MSETTHPLAAGLAARGLKPIQELAATREHGDRLRYIAGCRCADCRRANSAYESARQKARAAGDWNGLVPAEKARDHLKQLSELGVGRRSVAAASDVADSVLTEIIAGRKLKIRARTERAILAVTTAAAGDHALVPAKQTWKLINQLLKDGHTKGELAILLGAKHPNLQLKKDFVTVRNAHLVERLYEKLRWTCAKKTLKLLKKLVDEGYTSKQIRQHAAELAHSQGVEPVPLEARNGRIPFRTEALVERLHARLTE